MSQLDPQFVQNILNSTIDASLQKLLISILPKLDQNTINKIYSVIEEDLTAQNRIYEKAETKVEQTLKIFGEAVNRSYA